MFERVQDTALDKVPFLEKKNIVLNPLTKI